MSTLYGTAISLLKFGNFQNFFCALKIKTIFFLCSCENNCEGGPAFALKAEVKTKPYLITGGGLVLFIFAFGFAMKILEQYI